MKPVAMAAFTPAGRALLRRVAALLPGRELILFQPKSEGIRQWIAREFPRVGALLFVGATGIAVRLVAPHLRGKTKDPAVLVLDEAGRFVIPLLSGHLGGANRLALELASSLGATPVITTATDINDLFAVDTWSEAAGCTIANPGQIKDISAALLRGESVGLHSDFPLQGNPPPGIVPGPAPRGISVSCATASEYFPVTLRVIPRIAVLGAGCRKGTSSAAFRRFVLETLAERGISPLALRALATIDLKAQEPCLRDFAAEQGLEFRTFSASALAAIPGDFKASALVQRVTGVDNVCERAAVAAGGIRLHIAKTAKNGMTLALALPAWSCCFSLAGGSGTV